VRDQGVGFNSDDASRLFERFSRPGPLAHHSRGMGLGLFISKQIIDAHGGSIAAYSEGPSRGATLTVVLPISAQEPAVGGAAEDEQP
jgi:signal transduction histidine kinase